MLNGGSQLKRWGMVIVIIMLASLPGIAPASAQDTPAYWPTAGWRTSTPEAQGLDSAVLADMLTYVPNAHIDSVLVIRHGYMVLDVYAHPYRADVARNLRSVSKAFTGALVGIAIKQGLIAGVDQPVRDLLPNDNQWAGITVEHLLTMTSGIQYVDHAWNTRIVTPPGDTFDYNDTNTYLLAAAIQETSGIDTMTFARQNLFDPLGIDRAEWLTNSAGRIAAATGLYMTPHDMAKLGYLYLHDGMWDGAQIISADYVAASATPHVALGGGTGYGYQWKVSDQGYFWVPGTGGQIIAVAPDQDVVAVFTGSESTSETSWPLDLFERYILAAVRSDDRLPANPQALAALKNGIAALEHPQPVEVAALPTIAAEITSQTYILEDSDNPDWDSVALTFEDGASEAILTVERDGATTHIPVGLDGVDRVIEVENTVVGLRGFWFNNRFVLQLHDVTLPWRLTIQFGFHDDRLIAVWSEPVSSGRGSFAANIQRQ